MLDCSTSRTAKQIRITDPAEAAQRLIARWEPSPELFALENFGIRLWEAPPPGIRHAPHGQVDIVRTYGHPLSAVKSGRKTGKSTAVVIRAIHWMCVKQRPAVTLTAPTFQQVNDVLWVEFNRLAPLSRIPLGGTIYDTPHKGWVTKRGRLFGRTSDVAENLQGPSGADQLYIVDEASGYKDALLNALLGNMAGGGEMVLTFNPTQTTGITYNAFHSMADIFHLVNLSSLDTPNMTGTGEPIRGLMDPKYLGLLRRIWGEGGPAWQSHVLGQYPTGGINTIITLGMWDQAVAAWDSGFVPDDTLSIGVDCALYGDDSSVVTLRRGRKIYPQIVFNGIDGHELGWKILAIVACVRNHAEPVRVKVDNVGIGAECYGVLRHAATENNITVFPVGNGESPTSQPEAGPGYANLGCQTWFAAQDWFQNGGMIADDTETKNLKDYLDANNIHCEFAQESLGMLQGELTGRVYGYNSRGAYALEPKEKFKERIGRSPDRADSLILSIYEPPTMGRVKVGGRRRAAGFGGY